jgi:hypothetical protein
MPNKFVNIGESLDEFAKQIAATTTMHILLGIKKPELLSLKKEYGRIIINFKFYDKDDSLLDIYEIEYHPLKSGKFSQNFHDVFVKFLTHKFNGLKAEIDCLFITEQKEKKK